MTNAEQIAQWREEQHTITDTDPLAIFAMLAMLEQQQAQIDEAHGWIARAMMKGCCEEEITKEALQKFIDKRDLANKVEVLESLLLEVQWSGDMGEEVVTGNEIESRMYELKEQLKNGGEL